MVTPIPDKKTYKRCLPRYGCGEILPLSSFTPTLKGYSTNCRACQRKIAAQYKKNKEKVASIKLSGLKRCSPRIGCGRNRPLNEFPDTPKREHGSIRCRDCIDKSLKQALREEKAAARTRVCSAKDGCGCTLPVKNFAENATRKKTRLCRACERRRTLQFAKLAKQREIELQKKTGTYEEPKSRYIPADGWRYRMKSKYGITPETYESLVIAQDKKCAICLTPGKDLTKHSARSSEDFSYLNSPNLCVDQDQDANAVRGLLCNNCKIMISDFLESPELLRRASDYLSALWDAPLFHSSGISDNCDACQRTIDWLNYVGEPTDRVKLWAKALKRYDNITPSDYIHFLGAQNLSCTICRKHQDDAKYSGRTETQYVIPNFPRTLVVDHDHLTGRNRGLLCRECNWGLGRAKDSPRILQRAAEYLETHLMRYSERVEQEKIAQELSGLYDEAFFGYF